VVRQFGLALFGQRFGEGTGDILLDDVRCEGNETSLADCQHAEWGDHNCMHSEDVSVMCAENLDITGTAHIIFTMCFLSFRSFRCKCITSLIFVTHVTALDWIPPDFKKKKGRPRVSWTSTIKDLDLLGLTWDEALHLTKDRSEWKDCTARCASTA